MSVSNNISILSDEFVKDVDIITQFVVARNNQKEAFKWALFVEEKMIKERDELSRSNDLLKYYNKQLLYLKYIALPLLSEKTIFDLIENNFTFSFGILDYSILEKLKLKVINIELVDDKEEFKIELRKALQNNHETISASALIKSINAWLNDYNANVGSTVIDSLKRIQYIVDLNKKSGLSNIDKENLSVLFDLYDWLKLPYLTPQGYDADVPIKIDGKSYIFKQGTLNPIELDNSKIKKIQGILDDFYGTSNKEVDVLDELNAPLSTPVKSEEAKNEDLPMVVTPVAPLVSQAPNVVKPVIKAPTPLIVAQPAFADSSLLRQDSGGQAGVAKSAFVEEEVKATAVEKKSGPTNYGEARPASALRYGEARPLKTANNNEAKNKEIAQLQSLATNYPEGSLERRVVEEEIAKVEKR